jgi:hypothetical protein
MFASGVKPIWNAHLQTDVEREFEEQFWLQRGAGWRTAHGRIRNL